MFIIYLWDKDIGESITSLKDFSGNEKFLIMSDSCEYPLLSELSSCDMELFSDGQLPNLREEVKSLMVDQSLGQDVRDYLLSVIELINIAESDNKGILFSPF
ncbi:hypothetical protein [Serratia inhibens]|uniref:hypothetical protein n=1 Tax=Serratia inhibens TaxID=2338073 RepID=UPI00080996AB|nr:hypothetical protein [Serratia inhibens]ANS44135.1 hypothetical protein Q5A_018515 [Serratia inhibens PRI-2C]